jgi:transposase
MGEKRQRYPEEFKKETVKYIQQRAKSVPDIAEELNIPAGTIHKWLSQYRSLEHEPLVDANILTAQEKIHEQERELKAKSVEIEDLKEELEILKKAVHFFSKDRK